MEQRIAVRQVHGPVPEAEHFDVGQRIAAVRSAQMVWRGRVLGVALRTRPRANPLYVSVGHRVSLEAAVEWVLRTGRGYRLPEPTRLAHAAAKAVRRRAEERC